MTTPSSPADRAELVSAIEHAARDTASGTGAAAPALLLVNMDSFKRIGHSFGRPAADRILALAFDRLHETVGHAGMVWRLEGDEFAVLASAAGAEKAKGLAARIQHDLRDLGGGHKIALGGTGIGIRVIEPGCLGEQTLQEAGIALEAAKAEGPGAVRVFERAMLYAERVRGTLAEDLQEAILGGRIDVAYQPMVSLRTREIVGVEALARWDHPILGAVPPADFIPLAEDLGLGSELGRVVLTTALAQLHEWQEALGLAPGFALSVNISAGQLRSLNFADDVRQAITAAGVEPGNLVLELTEASFVSGTELDEYSMRSLRRLGVGLDIDDFGTGYSSISYLRRLPASRVKIDRSLLGDLANDPQERQFIAAVLNLVRACGLEAVFEGIETENQAEELILLGATTGQGYHFSRPLQPEPATALLRAGRIPRRSQA